MNLDAFFLKPYAVVKHRQAIVNLDLDYFNYSHAFLKMRNTIRYDLMTLIDFITIMDSYENCYAFEVAYSL